jgi:hypothetical protein
MGASTLTMGRRTARWVARAGWLALVTSVALALLVVASREARASEAGRNVDEANADLLAEPPRRDPARTALQAAVAAGDDRDAVAEAQMLLGRLDEEDGAYAQALQHDRACIDASSASRWAFRASDRIDWLRARSEGDFAPLRRLESIRHDPAKADDPATLEALARDADGFPPGMVRVEARMLVADAWLRRGRTTDAIALLRLVTGETKIAPLTQRLAEKELVDVLVAQGRLDEAIAEVTARPSRFDPRFVKQVKRLLVRRVVSYAATGILVAFGLLTAFAIAGAWRRGALGQAWKATRSLVPTAVVFVAFAAAGGGYLASEYETGNAQPFLLLGAAVLPLVLLARIWSAVGSQATAARVGRSLVCAATVMAAAFMLLDTINPQYLEGFGL